jgi:hypothetical protein
MTASGFRLALRLQRFEIWSCLLAVVVVGITALLVRARLEGVGAPVECITPWLFGNIVTDPAFCDPLATAFLQLKWEEAALVMNVMNVLPLAVGLVLGVGLVGREIEGGTAATVWALAGSRRRWLLGRLVPILAVLVVLLSFAAVTVGALADASVPWQFGRPTFDDPGLHGPGVVARGLAAFAVGLGVGAWSGRMLPTILISALLAFFLWAGGLLLLTGWVEANAHEMAVPTWFNGEYDGGRFTGRFQRLPDGTMIDPRFGDARSYAPPGVDPERWYAENVQVIAVGVVSSDYPAWVATETVAFGGVALVGVLATFLIVDRRRPF